MPELPDIVVYIERLRDHARDSRLQKIRVANPFVLRTVDPSLAEFKGRALVGVERIAKRIVYAQNESNYCARCQTGGRVLADRSLSRLLKKNWPRRIEELED